MIYGVIGDIHGNEEALREILRHLDQAGVDEIVCLGDIVGYNAGSNECVELLAERGVRAIAGNHELMALGALGTDRCADKVAYSIRQTRRDLRPELRAGLAELPLHRVIDGAFLLIHGAYGDPARYLRHAADVLETDQQVLAEHPATNLTFFGHTHDPRIWEVKDGRVIEHPVESTIVPPWQRLYVNPGSVDAQRKRSAPAAECAIYDSASRRLSFVRVPYDGVRAENKALVAGYRITPAARALYAGVRFLRDRRRGAVRRLRALVPG
jgi:predicted phosphodiesterase